MLPLNTAPTQAHRSAGQLRSYRTYESDTKPRILGLALGVTEVFCRAGSQRQFQLLLPSLAQHSHQGRWLTMVAPPSPLDKTSIQAAGVNVQAIRVIHAKSIRHYWATVEQCLLQGNSSVVIVWTDQGFCDELRQQLKEAALSGNCTAIVMRQLGVNHGEQNSQIKHQEADTGQLALAF